MSESADEMTGSVGAMRELVWGVKGSLVGYVRGMADGRIDVGSGARAEEGGFVFPAANAAQAPQTDPEVASTRPTGHRGALRFRGAVTFTGHSGMMHVTIADPSLVHGDSGWVLEIADPDDPAQRIPFATLAAFDGRSGTGVALTESGADLFFGPYEAGTPLDGLTIR